MLCKQGVVGSSPTFSTQVFYFPTTTKDFLVMVQIKFNVDDVLPQLNMVASVVNSKSPLPILNDVLVETFDDKEGGVGVMFTASDSESWLSCRARLIEGEVGVCICFDIKNLKQALSNFPGKELTMVVDEEAHTARFSHKKGHFNLPYENGGDYPHPSTEQEDEKSIIMPCAKLLEAIMVTSYATANETLRPIMNGIHLDFTKDYMIAAATDGCKLSRYQDDDVHMELEDGELKGFTFPQKPSQLLPSILAKVDGDVRLKFGTQMAIINNKDFKFVTRLLTFKYPPYERVIPPTSSIEFTINRSELVEALSRVIPLGNESSQFVCFHLESYKVLLSTENVEFSTSAMEEVDCDYMGEGLNIGFKGSFLMQTLKSLDTERITIKMESESRCGLFYPVGGDETIHHLGLLLPMQLK